MQQSQLNATKPCEFNLKTYLASGAMQFGTPAKIMIKAWISDGLKRLLAETPLSRDMLITPQQDGAHLTATVNDSWEFRWWILSHAGSIQIRSPNSLASEITQRLQSALNLQHLELDT